MKTDGFRLVLCSRGGRGYGYRHSGNGSGNTVTEGSGLDMNTYVDGYGGGGNGNGICGFRAGDGCGFGIGKATRGWIDGGGESRNE
jgi:hypothetical protein